MMETNKRTRLFSFVIILASMVGYLEWGAGNHSFLFEAEVALLSHFLSDPGNFVHPFTVIPLVGQLILLINLLMKRPRRWMMITGISCLTLLFLMMLVVGILSHNWKILVSVLPFFLLSILALRRRRMSSQ